MEGYHSYPPKHRRYHAEIAAAVENEYQHTEWSIGDFKQGEFTLFELCSSNPTLLTRPILATVISISAVDQAIALYYVPWWKEKPGSEFINPEVHMAIAWNDTLKFLGYWKHKPSAAEICKAYRTSPAWKYLKTLKNPPARKMITQKLGMSIDVELR